MIPRFASFEEVAALPLEQRRPLLRHPDAPTRIWAAWALALDPRGEARRALAEHLRQEREAGVRRQIAVVLAGLGARPLLELLLGEDPDERVRATAGQYLGILSTPPRDDDSRGALRSALLHDRPIVRETIVRYTDADLPWLETIRSELLCHESPDVRLAVAEHWLPMHEGRPFPDEARRLAMEDPDRPLRVRLAKLWVEHDRPEEIVRAIARTEPTERIIVLLDALIASHASLPWLELAPLAEHPDIEIRRRTIALAAEAETSIDLSWLIETLGELHIGRWWSLQGLASFRRALVQRLDELDRATLEQWVMLCLLRQELERYARARRDLVAEHEHKTVEDAVSRLRQRGWIEPRFQCRALAVSSRVSSFGLSGN